MLVNESTRFFFCVFSQIQLEYLFGNWKCIIYWGVNAKLFLKQWWISEIEHIHLYITFNIQKKYPSHTWVALDSVNILSSIPVIFPLFCFVCFSQNLDSNWKVLSNEMLGHCEWTPFCFWRLCRMNPILCFIFQGFSENETSSEYFEMQF